jgi:hypothetical protein
MCLPGKGELMKLRTALLACASLFVVGSAAFAEPPIGSRVGERIRKDDVNNQRDAVQSAHQLAGCIIVKQGSAARDLLNARSDQEVKKLQAKLTGDFECIADIPGNDFVEGVEVNYPQDVMRGDLAEEFIKRNRHDVSALQPLPLQRVYSRSWFQFTGRAVSVDEMAACVADTAPSAVVTLVDTQPFSDSEGNAFGSLVAYMGPCLRAGTKLEGKREPLRAALAEALYQRFANPNESIAAAPQTIAQAPQK